MFPLILACYVAVFSSVHAQPRPTGGSAYVAFHDRLYVQGGDLGGGNLVNQFYSLDLSRSWQTNSPVWNTLPSGPINAYHSGGFSADMNSFVTFGREAGSPYTTANFINIFSTSTGSWIGTGSTMIVDPTRRDMTVASDPSPGGQIYFMGGDAGQSGTGRSNALDIYNLKSSVVSETNVPLPGPQNLQGGAAAWLPNRNSMLVIGGLSDNTDTNVVYVYTPNTNTNANTNSNYNPTPGANVNSGSANTNGNGWTSQATTGYFPSLRTAHCVASNEDGSIVAVFGGFVNRSSTSDHSVYFLDTRTWTWTVSPSNSTRGRSYSTCAFSGNQFIVWGGFYQNPTSTPNNLPSVEECTMVYSLDTQNWVNSFVPSSSSFSGSGISGSGGSSTNSNGLSDTKGKSIGLLLAIAAVGAIMAMMITGGAIMVIRKRNQRRRNNSISTRPNPGPNNGPNSVNSTPPSSKKSVPGTWDQKTLTSLENGLNNGSKGANAVVTPGKIEMGNTQLDEVDDIPPVSGYSSWEHRGSIASYRGDDIETTMTKTTMTPMLGITQTTIVTTPKNSAKSTKVQPVSKTTYSPNTGSRMSEQDLERPPVSRTRTTFTRADVNENQTQDSWSEGHQQYVNQHNLEQEFEEKSQGAYFPISVEREYR